MEHSQGLVIVEKMENVTALAARSAKITCRTTNLADRKVAWIRRTGAAVLAVHTTRISPDTRIRVTHENGRTWHLHIDSVRPADQDWYTCQVNTPNVTQQHAFLEVTVPPDISSDGNMSEVTAFEGENVTLICRASGVPQPNVTWRREDDLPLPVHSPTPVYTMGGSRLELGVVRRHFSSDYYCIASNGWPPAVSKRVQLRVNFAPEVRAVRRVVTAVRGQNASLECAVEAWPRGLCYWSGPQPAAGRWSPRPGAVLQGGDRLRIGLLAAAAHYRRRLVLTVHSVAGTDFGRYRCACENPLGEAHDTVELRAAVSLAAEEGGYFDGLLDGYNVSQYLDWSGRLGSARHRRSLRPARSRAFSVGLLGVPDGTTLRFQLQVIRPFAQEYTDFLGSDQFKTEWYMSLRYKVSDLQANVFRHFQGPGRVNMTAAYHLMNATAHMMQNLTSPMTAAEDYPPMAPAGEVMSAMEQEGQGAGMAQYGQYSPERYWDDYYSYQGGRATPWDGYASRQGEVANEVGVEPDSELFEAQKFRIDQKMKIYQRMEKMYGRQGQDGFQCVQRAICEVAEAPMEDGVLGDVVNLLLSATDGVEELLHAKWLDKQYQPYLEAHMFGEMRGDCHQRYSGCALSVLDPTSMGFF
ncbi:Lachesin [Amphibalanus amphitrite]|uniref:Lachesin n=1 Tax=Amphibalanus amphitrite TaxID=1232801 RepID=A0A6A4W2I4_AMPAM|nr:Lachesin [Amphibalanus amphitrite]